MIVSKNHHLANKTEVSLKELENESFIVFSEENRDKMLSFFKLLNYTPKISLYPNQANMLGVLVTAGVGIAIIPNTPLINTSNLSTIKIKEDIGCKTIYMGYFKDSYMSPVTKKFKDYVMAAIK